MGHFILMADQVENLFQVEYVVVVEDLTLRVVQVRLLMLVVVLEEDLAETFL